MDYFRAKRFLDTLPDWETGTPPSGPLADYLPRMRALLARLDHPQRAFHTLIVGGTNGIWFLFPALGLYVCIRLILENSFRVIQG